MARTDTLPHFLTDVADAIRTKTGNSNLIQASTFDTEIENIPSGADLSNYFKDYVAYGTSTLGGWVSSIKKLPPMTLDNWTNAQYAFWNFRGTEIIITSSNQLTKTNNMFSGCNALQLIDMRKLRFTNVTSSSGMFSNVPNNCLIIVKDDTEKTWITTNFTNLTNVKTVAEYEASQN